MALTFLDKNRSILLRTVEGLVDVVVAYICKERPFVCASLFLWHRPAGREGATSHTKTHTHTHKHCVCVCVCVRVCVKGKKITCPFCREPWACLAKAKVTKTGSMSSRSVYTHTHTHTHTHTRRNIRHTEQCIEGNIW